MSEPRDAAARDATRDATAGRVYAPLVPSSASNSSIGPAIIILARVRGSSRLMGSRLQGAALCMCATRDRVDVLRVCGAACSCAALCASRGGRPSPSV